VRIGEPTVERHDGTVTYRVPVEAAEGPSALWYRLSEAHAALLTDLSDAPLVGLLVPAMARGEDIRVDGAVSERLYYTLSRQYQSVLRHVRPSLRTVRILPETLDNRSHQAVGVATGFSGGIDSFCVLADHHYGDSPPGFRLTHLLFNNVGSHGHDGGALFRARYRRLAPVADRLGLPFLAIDSNLDDFYAHTLSFMSTHTSRNASVALLLQGGIGRYLYASAYSFADVSVSQSAVGVEHADPVALPLLSTGTLDMLSVGSEYTRVEKTIRVAGLTDACSALDVCLRAQATANCSRCPKCTRTLFTLDLAGVVDRFGASFDLPAYRAARSRIAERILGNDDRLSREIVRFAGEQGYRFPAGARLRARLRALGRRLRGKA